MKNPLNGKSVAIIYESVDLLWHNLTLIGTSHGSPGRKGGFHTLDTDILWTQRDIAIWYHFCYCFTRVCCRAKSSDCLGEKASLRRHYSGHSEPPPPCLWTSHSHNVGAQTVQVCYGMLACSFECGLIIEALTTVYSEIPTC